MEIRAKAADARFKLACCQLPCNNNANILRLMMSCRLGKSCCPCQMRLPRWAWQLVWCFPLQVASSQPTPLSCWCTCMRKGRDAWYAHTCNAIESNVAEQHSVLRCADTTCYTVCSKFATLTMQHVHAAHTCCTVQTYQQLSWVQLLDLATSLLCLQDKYICRQHVQPKNCTDLDLNSRMESASGLETTSSVIEPAG